MPKIKMVDFCPNQVCLQYLSSISNGLQFLQNVENSLMDDGTTFLLPIGHKKVVPRKVVP